MVADRIQVLIDTLTSLARDARANQGNGNKSSATRVRVGLSKVAADCKEIRKEMQEEVATAVSSRQGN